MNLVERWFRELTDKAIRRGVFRSAPDLIAVIEDYLVSSNDHPKPFVWAATAEEILEEGPSMPRSLRTTGHAKTETLD